MKSLAERLGRDCSSPNPDDLINALDAMFTELREELCVAPSGPRRAYIGCISCDATGKTRGAICPRCDGVGFHAFVHAPSWEEQARAWRDIAECHLGAIQTLQSEIAAAQRELKRPVEITDEAVERAHETWVREGSMRAALEAALNHGDA